MEEIHLKEETGYGVLSEAQPEATCKRIGPFELFWDYTDDVYGKFNVGIQLSLTCVAIMLGWRTVGVMWLPKHRR